MFCLAANHNDFKLTFLINRKLVSSGPLDPHPSKGKQSLQLNQHQTMSNPAADPQPVKDIQGDGRWISMVQQIFSPFLLSRILIFSFFLFINPYAASLLFLSFLFLSFPFFFFPFPSHSLFILRLSSRSIPFYSVSFFPAILFSANF